MSLLHTSLACIQAVVLATALSGAAIGYAELMFQGTAFLYVRGHLLRYWPLPTDRNYASNFGSAFAFILPCTLYAYLGEGSWKLDAPRLVPLALSVCGYMVMHDAFFYLCHRTFHVFKPLYKALHEAHHEYSHAMNVFVVGYAEMLENFIQVGLPWLLWTAVIGRFGDHQLMLLLLPLSLTLFTTLAGHSGYRYSLAFVFFHPLIIPFVFTIGAKWMLTPGDHQVHHSHRRYNFGLFFRFWDIKFYTYQKCEVRAYDVNYWRNFVERNPADSSGMKKKVGFELVEVAATPWGF